MAKKRQLNVRLTDSLIDELEDRMHKTKLGMAALVEMLLEKALHLPTEDSGQSDRITELEQRIATIEAKLTLLAAPDSRQDASEITDELFEAASQNGDRLLTALDSNTLATRLGVTARAISQRIEKGTLVEWSKKHDPDSVGWEYAEADQQFHPQLLKK
jgi:hypothetical protein